MKKEDDDVEYRLLGNTGLKISTLSFGFWATYGVKEGVDRCVSVLRICRKAGINFFDNAEYYGKEYGDAETIMGKALIRLQKEDPKLWRRSDIVITTKLFWGPGGGQNELGLSRKHVMEGINGSLKRLQLDYVDVVFCHRPDPLTPTEEVVRAFTTLIRQGKAFCLVNNVYVYDFTDFSHIIFDSNICYFFRLGHVRMDSTTNNGSILDCKDGRINTSCC